MSNNFLKDWLHRGNLSQGDKLLLVLSSFEGAVPMKSILDRAEEAGVKRRIWANPSATLSRTKGLAIHTGDGWEITSAGRQKLANDGMVEASAGLINIAKDLRSYINGINSEEVVSFLNEAVRAYELGLYRSAVVMSWLAAIYVLQEFVLENHLVDFNNDAKAFIDKWKPVRSTDGFGRMKESDFLDRLVNIGMIGSNVKTALKECLDRRNACGHPNSYRVGQNMVTAHIETLILNVFTRFQ